MANRKMNEPPKMPVRQWSELMDEVHLLQEQPIQEVHRLSADAQLETLVLWWQIANLSPETSPLEDRRSEVIWLIVDQELEARQYARPESEHEKLLRLMDGEAE